MYVTTVCISLQNPLSIQANKQGAFTQSPTLTSSMVQGDPRRRPLVLTDTWTNERCCVFFSNQPLILSVRLDIDGGFSCWMLVLDVALASPCTLVLLLPVV